MRKNSTNGSHYFACFILALCISLSSSVLFAAPGDVSKKHLQTAQKFLIDYINERHVVTGREGLAIVAANDTNNGSIKVSFAQTIDGIPVDGTGLRVSLTVSTGAVHTVSGDFVTAGVARADNLVDGKTGIIDALASKGIFYPALISKPALVYVNSSNNALPAWRARVFYTSGRSRQVRDIYINANTGDFISAANRSNDVPQIGANHIALKANNKNVATAKRSSPAKESDAWFGPAPMDAVLKNCANDADNDCLNDDFEDWLGAQVAPIVFYDEDETCVAGIEATYRGVTDEGHYARKDFFQVRPRYYDIANWKADDGKLKTVVVSYILAYAHDCQEPFANLGGHQGDIEKVHYTLQSRDLKSWDLVEGHYRYHSSGKTVSGDIIQEFATRVGLDRPILAVSEGSHAGYFGNWFSSRSSKCDPHGDDQEKFLGITVMTDDCFCQLPDGSNGSPQECFHQTTQEQGRWINLADSLLANVGEPEQFRLGEFLQADDNGGVFTEFNVGHGLVREYWSDNTPDETQFGHFCGWECPNSARTGDDKNTCMFAIHGERKCVGPLSGKVDRGPFSVDPLPNNDPTPECNSNTPKPSKDCDDVLNPM